MAQKLKQQLREVGSKLESLPVSKDALIKLLKQAATCLAEVDQSPSPSMTESMQPCLNAIGKPELLKHQDKDVKLLLATCICEITRITAPEAPYSDDILRDIFHLIVGSFSGLSDINAPSFGRRVAILETLARYRSCVVMLDLECDDLVNEMFHTFLAVSSDSHPENVLASMQTIMVLLLDESEDIQEDLLLTLFSVLGREKCDVSMAARRLAMNVIEHCAGKLEPCIKQFLISSISGDNSSLNTQLDYHDVIYDLYQCAPQILCGITPYITGELLTDQLDVRLKAVKLLGGLFALPGHAISETFQPLLSEFLKRLSDRVVEVRVSVIEHVKNCLMANPFRAEAPDIITALCDRLLDYDENVRKQVVAAVYDVACYTLKSIPSETAKVVAERLRDKSLLVKRYTMERLAELYRFYCLEYSKGSISADEFDWMPGKILRCLYDKDFRSETIEVVLSGSLPPTEFSVKDRVKHWVTVFSGFEKIDVKALEKLLAQKQRLQQEMQKYLSLKQTYRDDGDDPELQKRILGCFRTMSRWFSDPAKAEEGFQILNQLKDANIWKILTCLLDPDTSFQQTYTCRDDLLKILGEKHPLYDFLDMLSLKCSYLPFNKELTKEILLEADAQKSSGNTKLILSCMNLLVILASSSPMFLMGAEEDLVHLLKEENGIIKEGIVHILAKAGGTIREKLATTSSSVDLLLETLCLEGSRKQAKYSVQALAGITKDDGLKSLSVLYKRLVDMLEKKTHLPAVLQSLGCIAQIAMPVFETREHEILEFITSKILERSNDSDDNTKTCWHERSELCLLKIYGIKALVKSYLPAKDAHLRVGIENLLGILVNILTFGEVSNDIKSSPVDKSHLRLASAKSVLRLSKYWDHKITVDIFHLTLRTSQAIYPEARRLFLSKVHQFIKERLLDAKYACAFLFNINGSCPPEFKEAKHNLIEVVQICRQLKARQLSMPSDMNSHTPVAYPEYIVAYLVHALAHHSTFPNIDECKEVQAFEPVYRQLHLCLSVLMHGHEDGHSQVSPNKEPGSISAIISIFQSIKCSEDVVDGMKSKNSHAICDLGLSITKLLVRNVADLVGLTTTVPLPPTLYKPLEKNKDDNPEASSAQSWLASDGILAHLESLKLEDKVHPDIAKDENALKDSDRVETEMPLRKMMKCLKYQGTKKKKVGRKHILPAERSNPENGFDILGMVREINVGNLERSKDMKSGKGADDHEYFASGEAADQNINKIVPSSWKKKKRNTGTAISMPVQKRKRPPFTKDVLISSNSRNTTKGRGKASQASSLNSIIPSLQSLQDSGVKSPMERDMVKPTESDLLASCLPAFKSFSSRRKEKGTIQSSSDMSVVGKAIKHDKEFLELVDTDKKNSFHNGKISVGSFKKRKRRSIAVLAKCSLANIERQNAELIGCRVKVWWPIDKQFYEGVVQSYDPGKKKHVILYNDGDTEVLQLDKEQWEVISNDYKPRKRLKSSKVSPSKGMFAEQEKRGRIPGVSRRNNNSTKKFRRKGASKRSVQHGDGGLSENNIDVDTSEAENGGTSHVSNAHPHASSEVDDINSGEGVGNLASLSEAKERIEEGPTDPKESDKGENPDSPNTDSAGDSDKEEIPDSPDTGSAGDSYKENPDFPETGDGGDSDKVEKPDSPNAGDSDDEPLSVWKLRASKVA
ncbi:sister chromatid cohesion protein PDS5 homolog A-like isoform X2 [Tasmannia lanceolata]|uniref:sister chromatid cohesion protein PDS5 homolog A-like isoform X2 n=1 Tax=Tasmannia lanceolata TaxID=3420 RepID=UPI0040632F04